MWNKCMDAKGLKVNFAKTKDMESGIIGCGEIESSMNWPCAVGKKSVIKCSRCDKWLHSTYKL